MRLRAYLFRTFFALHHPACLAGAVDVQVYGFPDFVSALAFKRKAWLSVGLPAPPLQELVANNTLRMITILDRAISKPRHIHNIQDVIVRRGVFVGVCVVACVFVFVYV